MIYTFGGSCAYCGHNWKDHTFRSSYKDKVQKKKKKTEKIFKKNPEKKRETKRKMKSKNNFLLKLERIRQN